MKRLPLIISVVLLAVVAGGAWLYWHWEKDPLPFAQAVDVEILPGESLHHVAQEFADKGILVHAWDLVVYARLHEASRGLRAGEYSIEPGTTVAGLLDLLRSGRVVMHSLTLVEGWNLKQVMAAVQQEPNLKHTLPDKLSLAALAHALDIDAASPEGMLMPDTYQFPRGTSDVAFLKRAHESEQQELEKQWADRAPDLPYSQPYDALIMASIVEKETAQPLERGKIAGVFVRRLQKGMKLQTDPSVIYGLGDAYDGDITFKDLRTDTPYNTYTRYGLTPTPICMPGRAALEAALHPEVGNALYFVARGDGTHQFSATLKQQNEAVAKYQLKHGK